MKKRSKKQRTIAAIVDLIHAQNNGKWVARTWACPLCRIHGNIKDKGHCKGCPVADEAGGTGCIDWGSYAIDNIDVIFNGYGRGKYFNPRRARFWLHNLPYILAQPESRFTKKGWKYFELEEVD